MPTSFKWIYLAAVPLVLYLACALGYALQPFLMDHMEVSVGLNCLRVFQGSPVYTLPGGDGIYSFGYGPYSSLPAATLLGLGFDPLPAIKLTGLIHALCSVGLVYGAGHLRKGMAAGLGQAGLFALVALSFGYFPFSNRAEAFLTVLTAAGSFALAAGPRKYIPAALGVLIGMAAGTKFYAILFFIPLFLEIRPWPRSCELLVVITLGATAALLPFLLFPSFHFQSYIGLLQILSRHPLQPGLFWDALGFSFYLGFPLLIYVFGQRASGAPAQSPLVLCGLAISALGLCVFASKPGSGSYYFFPFLPVLVYLTWDQATAFMSGISPGRTSKILAAGLAALWIFSLAATYPFYQFRFFFSSKRDAGPCARELTKFIRDHPRLVLQMGFAGKPGFVDTQYRILLSDKHNLSLVDDSTLADWTLGGVDTTTLLCDLLEAETADVWIMPRQGAPFSKLIGYFPTHEINNALVTHSFLEHYVKKESGECYDYYYSRKILGTVSP